MRRDMHFRPIGLPVSRGSVPECPAGAPSNDVAMCLEDSRIARKHRHPSESKYHFDNSEL